MKRDKLRVATPFPTLIYIRVWLWFSLFKKLIEIAISHVLHNHAHGVITADAQQANNILVPEASHGFHFLEEIILNVLIYVRLKRLNCYCCFLAVFILFPNLA